MANKICRVLFLNQMAGPLFRELAEGLAEEFPEKSALKTGHPDTISIGSSSSKLDIDKFPEYNRKSYFTRIFSWFLYTLLSAITILKANKDTLIFIVSNPPLLGPLAWLMKKIRGVQYVVLVYDIHPDTMISFGVLKESSSIVSVWRWINRKVWSNAIAVYTLGQVMAERLSGQFDVKKTRLGSVGVIPPWADTDKIKPINKEDNPLAKEFGQLDSLTVLYSGNMGISHDIDSILEAAYLLRDNKEISFLMIGEGAKWQDAYDFQLKHNLRNLQVLPFQSEDKLPYTMPLADIALVALDEGAEGLMIPSKMFYYMSAGSSVLGICKGHNDVSHVIEISNCGVTVEPKEPQKIADAIVKLSSDRSRLDLYKFNSRESAKVKYSRQACIAKFSKSILSVLND